MKESLRQKLNDWIKSENGKTIPIDVIERQVKLWGYKTSNAERRLRDSDSPNVGKVTHNGAIVGYYWRSALPITAKAKEFLEKWQPKEEKKTNQLQLL